MFVSVPADHIIAAVVNASRSMHNSQGSLSGGVHKKLERFCNLKDGKTVAHSAFDKTNQKFIIKSSQDDMLADEREDVNHK